MKKHLQDEVIIKNGAIFIADAHENEQRRGFWNFLCALKEGKVKTSQLFLMGDIFDLLIGEISATHNFAKKYIILLEELSNDVEIFYLEGNHDFNLSYFFKKVKIFPLKKQPLKAIFYTEKGEKIDFFLAHGDIFLNPFLGFILKNLRRHSLLCFLNFLNKITFDFISKRILENQKKKNLFFKINNFENLIYQRYEKYNANNAWVIEGHYHQNFILNNENIKYFNLNSFAYKESFFVVEYSQEIKFQEQNLRGQNV